MARGSNLKTILNKSSHLQFAVIHWGARLHYGVAEALERAGMLQTLYTDAHAESGGLFRLGALPAAVQPHALRRLLSRRIPTTIPRTKIRSWVWPALQSEWFNHFRPAWRKNARMQWKHRLGVHWLAQRAIAENFGGANALYVHPCASTDAVREAKRRGMFVVLEAISHPFNKLVEKAEYERFGLAGPEPEIELRDNIAFFKEEAMLADLVFAASPYVREGLIDLGLHPERIAVVPYGLDPGFFSEAATPEPGRVLYVGNIGYLKGVPHLAAAARRLKASGFVGEIRAIGSHDGLLIQRPEFHGLHYLGQVPRADVRQEFLNADVFAFPTLSDGFGIVLLEALLAGLPIICTPNCGGVVRDGINGRVVPTHDVNNLAAAINEIVGNREQRAEMSRNALGLAHGFTSEAYQQRLVATLHGAFRAN